MKSWVNSIAHITHRFKWLFMLFLNMKALKFAFASSRSSPGASMFPHLRLSLCERLMLSFNTLYTDWLTVQHGDRRLNLQFLILPVKQFNRKQRQRGLHGYYNRTVARQLFKDSRFILSHRKHINPCNEIAFGAASLWMDDLIKKCCCSNVLCIFIIIHCDKK